VGGAMSLQEKIEHMEVQIEHLLKESERMRSMLTAACEQINVVHGRVDKVEKSATEDRDYAVHRLGVHKFILDEIGQTLYPIFYKVFPEAIESDNALNRIVEQSKKKP
jgi:predicted Holliday junction resolvase-like endonuclease